MAAAVIDTYDLIRDMKNALEQHVDELGGWYGEHKERVSELEDLINRAVDYLAERDAEMEPDFSDNEPRAWHIIEARTAPDGSITATESTNDNLDRGYASEFAEWERNFRNRAMFDSQAGKSRIGCGGVAVDVYLDGQRI